MVFYKIEWKTSAKKELKKLEKSIIPKIIKAVEDLANHTNPIGSRKLKGAKFTYRLRVGNYRIIYSIISTKLIIEIIKVGHRKEIYKKLS